MSTPLAKRVNKVRRRLGTPEYVINLSRSHSVRAIKVLSEILDDDKQPVVARIRCAELLLERGFGKAPQAMLLATADGESKSGIHALPIMERIAQLRQAKDAPITTDLEASEIQEIPMLDCPDLTPEESPI